jgi:hypothetical protein
MNRMMRLYYYGVLGAIGGLIAWQASNLLGLSFAGNVYLSEILVGALIGVCIGFMIGAAEGLAARSPRLALRAGLITGGLGCWAARWVCRWQKRFFRRWAARCGRARWAGPSLAC